MPGRKIIILIILIGFLTMLLIQCKNSEDSEAVKLLREKQAISQKQTQLIDSLKQEQIRSQKEKGELIEKMKAFKEEKHSSDKSLKKNLQLKKAEYENDLMRIGQELDAVDFRLSELGKRKKELSNQSAYTDTAKIWAKQHVRNEISEIDQIMDSLEKEQELEKKKIPILQKKMEISEKKLAALEEETELYLEQKNNLIRNDGSDEALNSINKQIAGIDTEINKEKQKYVQTESEMNGAKSRITEIDIQLQQMVKSIQQKQSKKEALNEFIASEKEQLNTKKNEITEEISLLVDEKNSLIKNEESIQLKIDALNEKIQGLNEINQDSEIEQDKNKKSETKEGIDEDLTIEKDTDDIKDEINSTSGMQEKLKQTESTTVKNDNGLTVLYVLVLIVIFVILVFYFVGKRNKSKRELK